jgi:hypothetical protein
LTSRLFHFYRVRVIPGPQSFLQPQQEHLPRAVAGNSGETISRLSRLGSRSLKKNWVSAER